MSHAESNKAFMQELLSQAKKLDEFPDHVAPDLVIYQPTSLPFGGTYHGLSELQRIYPQIGAFYDFSRFELLGLYADGDTVFASIKIGVAGSTSVIYLAEKWTFRGTQVTEIRVHVCQSSS